jgi:hypothetical protein
LNFPAWTRLKKALQRMLIFLGEGENSGDLFLRQFVSVVSALRPSFMVDAQHQTCGSQFAYVKETL